MRKHTIPAALIVILLVAWALLTVRMSAPWYGVQEAGRVWISAAVRNHEFYGIERTGLMMTRRTAPVPDAEDLGYYSHHPPMGVWVPTIVTQITGFHETGMRFGFMALTLISLCIFYVLVRRLYGVRVGIWAVFFFSLTPMVAYMGGQPGFAQASIIVALLYFAVLIDWVRKPTRGRLIALIALAWLAVWTAWAAVFFIACGGLVAMLLGDKRHRVAVVGFGAVCVAAFITLITYYQSVWDGAINSILEAFVWRTSTASWRPETEPFTALEYAYRLTHDVAVYGSMSLILLAAFGLFALYKFGSSQTNFFTFGLLVSGMFYLLAFPNASYIHDYYKVYIFPALAISAAMTVVHLRSHAGIKRFMRPVVDGLLVALFLSGGFIFVVLHSAGAQPVLSAIINTVNDTHQPGDKVAVFLEDAALNGQHGGRHERVIEFYTRQPVEMWQATPSDALSLDTEDTGRVLYIYCRNPENHAATPTEEQAAAQAELHLLDAHPGTPIDEVRCTLYIFSADDDAA